MTCKVNSVVRVQELLPRLDASRRGPSVATLVRDRRATAFCCCSIVEARAIRPGGQAYINSHGATRVTTGDFSGDFIHATTIAASIVVESQCLQSTNKNKFLNSSYHEKKTIEKADEKRGPREAEQGPSARRPDHGRASGAWSGVWNRESGLGIMLGGFGGYHGGHTAQTERVRGGTDCALCSFHCVKAEWRERLVPCERTWTYLKTSRHTRVQ